jgi:MYXO-CTERM domain-containing protein
MRARPIGVVLSWCTAALPAGATYSIVGADSVTREVGGAGASCLRGGDVSRIYGSVPGVGVVHAQATWNEAGLERALELLGNGEAPRDVLQALVVPSFDPQASTRQYGLVDVTGRAAGFTGEDAHAYAADRQGAIASVHYSVQGNLLTSERVLTQAAAAFEASGCDLAERLLLALEAGGANDEGDGRCTTSRGIPSDSAYLEVDRPDEPRGSFLRLRVPTSGDADPLVTLREQFVTWRETHPCPHAGTAGAAGSAAAGNPAVPPAAAGSTASQGAETAGAKDGCSCRSAAGSDAGSGFWLGLAGVTFWARRRPQA